MKKIAILLCSILCVIVCSCEKASQEPQDLLIGTWQVTKIVYSASVINAQKTVDMEDQNTFYVFAEGGTGKRWSGNNVQDFTYVFNEETNSVFVTQKGNESVWKVEVLTVDQLVYHTKAEVVAPVSSDAQVFCIKVKK